MIIMDNEWNLKEEIPTTRFWLMTKLLLGWDRNWDFYIDSIKERLINLMTVPNLAGLPRANEDPNKEKLIAVKKILEKLETSAWRTVPSSFLRDLGIPRVLRR